MDEKLIKSVSTAIDIGASIEDIHDSLAQRNLSEDDIYLIFNAAKLYSKFTSDHIEEVNNKKKNMFTVRRKI